MPWDLRRGRGPWVPDGIRGTNTHHPAGVFFASVHHASSFALRESRKTLETRGFEAVRRVFLPTRFGEEPLTSEGNHYGGQILKKVVNSIGMELVFIPAGEFTMGIPDVLGVILGVRPNCKLFQGPGGQT